MRGAFSVLLFFVCLNLSFYIIHETQPLPYAIEAPETPASIQAMTLDRVTSSLTVLVAGTLVGVLLKKYVFGAALAMILFALSFLLPIVDWLILGFPRFLATIGVPTVISTSLNVLFALVWFWLLIGIISQRYMEQ